MNNVLFSEHTKMADVILTNSRLLWVLPYFEMNLGFGEKTVKQVCNENHTSVPLFLLVCNIYTFDDYYPESRDLKEIPIEGIIMYLQKSHPDYLKIRMPQLIDSILNLANICHIKNIDSILNLANICHIKNGNMLHVFCEKYKQEVIAHFKYEEEIVFPYITQLLNGVKDTHYKIKEYETHHSDIDAALNDLKNIIIKYLPQDCTIEKCRSILLNLSMYEYDLRKHTLLEDKILVSLVELIEKKPDETH